MNVRVCKDVIQVIDTMFNFHEIVGILLKKQENYVDIVKVSGSSPLSLTTSFTAFSQFSIVIKKFICSLYSPLRLSYKCYNCFESSSVTDL